ncbi:MAG: hypothetical protein ACI4VF_09510 [Lachnospirales bacterium]
MNRQGDGYIALQDIAVDENMSINVPMLYAVGDCRGGLLHVAKFVCDGAVAGINIIKRLKK